MAEAASERSDALFERAQRVIPGGVNSPVRSFRSVGGHPYFVARGDGAYVWDADGNRLLDYVQSYGASILGHAHPSVVKAVADAAADGTTFGAPTEGEVRLAELICGRVEGCERVRLVSSGTEAAMTAVRVARGFTGRSRIIKFAGCYHGHSDGLLAGGGAAWPPSAYRIRPACHERPWPRRSSPPTTSFPKWVEDVACVIVEPVAANMGLVPPEAGFLEGLRAACDAAGALLVFDEVITGFRLGPSGASGKLGVRPDLWCFGKVIGGGLPVGAVGGTADVLAVLAPDGPVYQAGTLSGNPLATAAGIAVLEALDEESYETLAGRVSAFAGELEGVLNEALVTRPPRGEVSPAARGPGSGGRADLRCLLRPGRGTSRAGLRRGGRGGGHRCLRPVLPRPSAKGSGHRTRPLRSGLSLPGPWRCRIRPHPEGSQGGRYRVERVTGRPSDHQAARWVSMKAVVYADAAPGRAPSVRSSRSFCWPRSVRSGCGDAWCAAGGGSYEGAPMTIGITELPPEGMQLGGVVLAGDTARGTRTTEGLSLLFTTAGITVQGPQPQIERLLVWSGLDSATCNEKIAMADGRNAAVMELTSGGQSIRFLLPTDTVSPGQAAYLDQALPAWLARYRGNDEPLGASHGDPSTEGEPGEGAVVTEHRPPPPAAPRPGPPPPAASHPAPPPPGASRPAPPPPGASSPAPPPPAASSPAPPPPAASSPSPATTRPSPAPSPQPTAQPTPQPAAARAGSGSVATGTLNGSGGTSSASMAATASRPSAPPPPAPTTAPPPPSPSAGPPPPVPPPVPPPPTMPGTATWVLSVDPMPEGTAWDNPPLGEDLAIQPLPRPRNGGDGARPRPPPHPLPPRPPPPLPASALAASASAPSPTVVPPVEPSTGQSAAPITEPAVNGRSEAAGSGPASGPATRTAPDAPDPWAASDTRAPGDDLVRNPSSPQRTTPSRDRDARLGWPSWAPSCSS